MEIVGDNKLLKSVVWSIAAVEDYLSYINDLRCKERVQLTIRNEIKLS